MLPTSRWLRLKPLTVVQIASLDTVCFYHSLAAQVTNGSLSALQTSYPGTKISTLDELFSFARCVDSERRLLWNIESKINPVDTNSTRSPDDFVKAQYKLFVKSGYKLNQIAVWVFHRFIMNSILRSSSYSIKALIGGLSFK